MGCTKSKVVEPVSPDGTLLAKQDCKTTAKALVDEAQAAYTASDSVVERGVGGTISGAWWNPGSTEEELTKDEDAKFNGAAKAEPGKETAASEYQYAVEEQTVAVTATSEPARCDFLFCG